MAEKIEIGNITITPSKLFFLSGLASCLSNPLLFITLVIVKANENNISENILTIVLCFFLLNAVFAVTGYFTYFGMKLDLMILDFLDNYRGSACYAGHGLSYLALIICLMIALSDYTICTYLDDLWVFHYCISTYILFFVVLIVAGFEA